MIVISRNECSTLGEVKALVETFLGGHLLKVNEEMVIKIGDGYFEVRIEKGDGNE